MKPEVETVSLPVPARDGGVAVERALQNRRSIREFSDAPLTLKEISQLLWAAQGINDPEGHRTAPSAGALYPLEVYLVAGNVKGLAAGIYKYRTARHELTPQADGDKRDELTKAAFEQEWIANGAAVLVVTAAERRATRKYGQRGIRYIQIEVGHVGQNIFLQAMSLGLAAAVVGAFDDNHVAQLMGLAATERPLYLLPVGRL